MKKTKRPASQSEAMRKRWETRIMLEKGYTETCARWMAKRIEKLLDHMQYGHALIAYRKQEGTFNLAKGTLVHYENDFRKRYDPGTVTGAVAYWDVEQQGWRTFQIENFLDWRPIV